MRSSYVYNKAPGSNRRYLNDFKVKKGNSSGEIMMDSNPGAVCCISVVLPAPRRLFHWCEALIYRIMPGNLSYAWEVEITRG